MAIAEALQSGTPVLTTTGTPWQELPEYRCGWWIPLNEATLIDALRNALDTPAAELHEMGERGRRLIREKYSWNGVAARTIEVYRSIMAK